MKKVILILALIIIFVPGCSLRNGNNSSDVLLSTSLYDAAYYDGNKITIMGETKYGLSINEDNVTVTPNHDICDLACATTFMAWCDTKGEVYVLGKIKEKQGSRRYDKAHQMIGLSQITEISAGDNFFLAKDSSGNVWGHGDNSYGQIIPNDEKNFFDEPVRIDSIKKVKALECGFHTSCIINSSGRAYLWGEDNCNLSLDATKTFEAFYELGMENVEEVCIGRNHMIVRSDNELIGYGDNYFGQLGERNDADMKIINLESDTVQMVECGISSSILISDDKVYYLGALNLNDDAHDVFQKLDINTPEMISCTGYHFYYLANKKIHEVKIDEKVQEEQIDIAMIDTGVNKAMFPELNSDKSTDIFKALSWNISRNNTDVFEGFSVDAHGTSMYTIISDYYAEAGSGKKKPESKIKSMKAVDVGRNNYVDIYIALEIAKKTGAKVINCSFSIEDLYEYPFRASCNDLRSSLILMAIDNDGSKTQCLIRQDNIIYVYENGMAIDKAILSKVNAAAIQMGDVVCSDMYGKKIVAGGNSAATAKLTRDILEKYISKNKKIDDATVIGH